MKKGRSIYTFKFSCDVQTINSLLQNYLTSNGFQPYIKSGEQYYRAGDSMLGYRGFLYSINGDNLIINAWLDGAMGNFPIEQKNYNILAMDYRNSLVQLFNEISKLNIGGNNMNNNQINMGQDNQNYNNSQYNPNQFAENFQSETNKKKEKMCEIGFWISIFGIICSFTGVSFGLLVYIMDFYFASQGLKTRKRGKAIATIVLSIISILILIFSVIIMVGE